MSCLCLLGDQMLWSKQHPAKPSDCSQTAPKPVTNSAVRGREIQTPLFARHNLRTVITSGKPDEPFSLTITGGAVPSTIIDVKPRNLRTTTSDAVTENPGESSQSPVETGLASSRSRPRSRRAGPGGPAGRSPEMIKTRPVWDCGLPSKRPGVVPGRSVWGGIPRRVVSGSSLGAWHSAS